MPKVVVLPDHVASQIAAGEVVERPASVVKEFVENAIDAGAQHIEITVSSDCRDIRIADDGCGMAADDAVLAFQRHATSKIKSADDLWSLNSLGFRGEALPSIASVSHLTCITRAADTAIGSRVQSADGKISAIETGCAKGTIMEVVDLFYNVPARLNFLKKPSTEFAHILEVVQSLAIANPHIAFVLLKQDEQVLRASGSGDLRQTVFEIGHLTGRETLLEIQYEDEQSKISVNGLAAKPLHFRGDRKGILTIVNRRPVRCALTYRALDYAYSDLIPRGKYPLAVLCVTVDPAHVDVNIHPTKKEVKYSNANEVYLVIQRAISQSLRNGSSKQVAAYEEIKGMPELMVFESSTVIGGGVDSQLALLPPSVQHFEPMTEITSSYLSASTCANGPTITLAEPAAEQPRLLGHRQTLLPEPVQERGLPRDVRIAGYVHNTYILLETTAGLEIIEQHIAHERILYERLLTQQSIRGRTSENIQSFLVSAPLHLSPEQESQIQTNFQLLNQLGFDFKWEADGAVACTQIPQELAGKNYAVVIQQILDDLSKTDAANLALEATKSIACQAAIKNGMRLGNAEIVQLLTEWSQTPRNDTCPHGSGPNPISTGKTFPNFPSVKIGQLRALRQRLFPGRNREHDASSCSLGAIESTTPVAVPWAQLRARRQ